MDNRRLVLLGLVMATTLAFADLADVRRAQERLDEKGEYVYLDEETRQAEILRMKQLIAENCEPAKD